MPPAAPLPVRRGLISPAMTKQRSFPLLILLIALLYALDQITKWYIVLHYDAPGPYWLDATPVITENPIIHFHILRIHNQGVAFGFGNGTAWAPFLFFGVQIIALVVLILFYRRGFFSTRLLKLSWALIMAGVLGNMTDRLTQGFFLPGADNLSFLQNLTNGYVVDFLDFSFPWLQTALFPGGYHWPAFNVADSCVCCAAVCFFIASFVGEKTSRDNTKSSSETPDKNEPARP